MSGGIGLKTSGGNPRVPSSPRSYLRKYGLIAHKVIVSNAHFSGREDLVKSRQEWREASQGAVVSVVQHSPSKPRLWVWSLPLENNETKKICRSIYTIRNSKVGFCFRIKRNYTTWQLRCLWSRASEWLSQWIITKHTLSPFSIAITEYPRVGNLFGSQFWRWRSPRAWYWHLLCIWQRPFCVPVQFC